MNFEKTRGIIQEKKVFAKGDFAPPSEALQHLIKDREHSELLERKSLENWMDVKIKNWPKSIRLSHSLGGRARGKRDKKRRLIYG